MRKFRERFALLIAPWLAQPKVDPQWWTYATVPTTTTYYQRTDCGCPLNRVCGNTACPRACRVTCSTVADVLSTQIGGTAALAAQTPGFSGSRVRY
jgi:hypothetical protein